MSVCMSESTHDGRSSVVIHKPISIIICSRILFSGSTDIYIILLNKKKLRPVVAQRTGCGFDPHSRRWNIYLNLYLHFFAPVSRLSAALSSAIQRAMPLEFGRKWGTECLNTKCPLPTLLCAGYSVKLIFF